jgi:hypothetical protein
MIPGAFDLLLNFWRGHRCILPQNFLNFLSIGLPVMSVAAARPRSRWWR